MTFEKWREKLRHLRSTKNLASLELTNCIADWKDEREFYLPQNQDLTEANNSMGPKMIKLIGALADCCRMFKWCDDHYGAVLAEAKGGE